jgi:hypothetical protein
MRTAIGLLLLLIQFEPLGGAAMCLLATPAEHEACGPSRDYDSAMLQAASGSARGAACQFALCAPAVPAVPVTAGAGIFQLAPTHPLAPSWVPVLHPTDPASPPLPPPIA